MKNLSWLTPLAGILFVVLAIVGFAISGEPPDPADDTASEIVEFYVDNKDDVMLGSIIGAVSAMFLVLFGAYVAKVTRAAGAEWSANLVLGGAVALAVAGCLDHTINIALAENADDIDPSAVQALSSLWNNDFLPLGLGTFVFTVGLGSAIVNNERLPSWLGWIAIVGGLTAVSPAFFIALIVMALVILITSVMLMLQERSDAAT